MLDDMRVLRRVRVSDVPHALASGLGTTAVNVPSTCLEHAHPRHAVGKPNVARFESKATRLFVSSCGTHHSVSKDNSFDQSFHSFSRISCGTHHSVSKDNSFDQSFHSFSRIWCGKEVSISKDNSFDKSFHSFCRISRGTEFSISKDNSFDKSFHSL